MKIPTHPDMDHSASAAARAYFGLDDPTITDRECFLAGFAALSRLMGEHAPDSPAARRLKEAQDICARFFLAMPPSWLGATFARFQAVGIIDEAVVALRGRMGRGHQASEETQP